MSIKQWKGVSGTLVSSAKGSENTSLAEERVDFEDLGRGRIERFRLTEAEEKSAVNRSCFSGENLRFSGVLFPFKTADLSKISVEVKVILGVAGGIEAFLGNFPLEKSHLTFSVMGWQMLESECLWYTTCLSFPSTSTEFPLSSIDLFSPIFPLFR
jgi:hypothetical protein